MDDTIRKAIFHMRTAGEVKWNNFSVVGINMIEYYLNYKSLLSNQLYIIHRTMIHPQMVN